MGYPENNGILSVFTPSTGAWEPGHTESWFRAPHPEFGKNAENGFPIYKNADAKKVAGVKKSHKTQNKSTLATYRQLYMRLALHMGIEAARKTVILDASSGLGLGTRAGRDRGYTVIDVEPFPGNRYAYDNVRDGKKAKTGKPQFVTYDAVAEAIGKGEIERPELIVSNAVLNVVPQDTRDELVTRMGELLAPGGAMFVNVMAKTYAGALEATDFEQYDEKGQLIGAIVTQEGTGCPTSNNDGTGREIYVWKTNSVQKVFSVPELIGYLKDALGDGFTVTPAKGIGMTAAWVTKAGAEQIVPDSVLDREERAKPKKVIINDAYPERRSGNRLDESVRHTVTEAFAELTEKQQKNARKNLSNDRVGSPLYTTAGTKVGRYADSVGKDVSGNIYFHRNYAESIVPDFILTKALDVLDKYIEERKRKDASYSFTYNCMMYQTSTGDLRFDEAPDFDAAREPVPGRVITVHPEGYAEESKTAYYNQASIWHHKWLWVRNDYQGFDVEEAWEWSRAYLSVIRQIDPEVHCFSNNKEMKDQKKVSFSNRGIADPVVWDEQLRYFGLQRKEDCCGVAVCDAAS